MPRVTIEYAIASAAERGSGQDRARVFEHDGDVIIALADGAGGTPRGAAAAQAIVDAVATVGAAQHDWSGLLVELDLDERRLGRGQSTAVIVSLTRGVLAGASAGDSGAWLIRDGNVLDLTEHQQRKPFVGGGCVPVRIEPVALESGTVLVASDGLLRYATRSDIVAIAEQVDLTAAARALVELVRLPSGTLQDDVTVVLCREHE